MLDILQTIVMDVVGSVGTVFTASGWVTLGMLIAIGALGAVATGSLGEAFSSAVWGLPLFALVSYFKNALTLTREETFGRSPWIEALDQGWESIARMDGLELIGLYFALAIVVLLGYLVKVAISRG